jgi:hypothetical protein
MTQSPHRSRSTRPTAGSSSGSAWRSFSLLVILSVALAGCATLAPQRETSAVTVDRSWSAVIGAFSDEGLTVVREDPAEGVLEGQREGIIVAARVGAQADGSVRVDLRASGDRHRDPGLLQRIVRAYDRRMGR